MKQTKRGRLNHWEGEKGAFPLKEAGEGNAFKWVLSDAQRTEKHLASNKQDRQERQMKACF